MKVCILQRTPFPEGTAGTQRVKCYAKALQQYCDVKILIACQCRPCNVEREGIYDGLPYKFISPICKKSSNSILRLLQTIYQELNLALYLLGNLKKGDILLSYFLSVFYGPLDIFVTHVKRAKFVAELCELPYGTSKETPTAIKNRRIVLKKLYPKIDGVIAISEALQTLAKKYVRKDVLVLKVPILVDYSKYDIEDLSDQTDIPYIFHAGSLLQQKDGFLDMLDAFALARKEIGTHFQFICTGSVEKSRDKKEILEIIHKYDIEDDVIFTGYLTDEQLKSYLQKASLVIINKHHNQQNEYCFSTKLGEYMAAGKAIIITNVGEAMNWLTDQKDCLIVEPGNTLSLARSIKTLMDDARLRSFLGHNSKLTCKGSFEYKVWGMEIHKYFNNL